MNNQHKQLNTGKGHIEDAHHYNFDVMKPFLKFGVNAMSAIGHTLMGIVRNIPKPQHHQEDDHRGGKIIKIG